MEASAPLPLWKQRENVMDAISQRKLLINLLNAEIKTAEKTLEILLEDLAELDRRIGETEKT